MSLEFRYFDIHCHSGCLEERSHSKVSARRRPLYNIYGHGTNTLQTLSKRKTIDVCFNQLKLLTHHHSPKYYCFHEPCASNNVFLETLEDLKQHFTDTHGVSNAQETLNSNYYCSNDECAELEPFASKFEVEQHIRDNHISGGSAVVDCEYQGCHRVGSKGFKRKGEMLAHMRRTHKVDVPLLLWGKDGDKSVDKRLVMK